MEELTPKKIEQLNKQPIIETSVSRSEDGKWFIYKTTIKDIRSTKYIEKVLSRQGAGANAE